MNNFKEILKEKKIIITVIGIVGLIVIGMLLYLNHDSYENMQSIEELEEIDEALQEKQIEENIVAENSNQIEDVETEKIAVHIIGAVKKTGILYLSKGARVIDAIEMAGGATKQANLDQVNLAYILEDGQKIYIPSKNEKIGTGEYIISNSGNNVLVEDGKSTSSTKDTKGDSKVNINSANQTELETLPGIGPALAQRIIEYRQQNGKFEKIEDIQNVKGIGDNKYSNIKDNICI